MVSKIRQIILKKGCNLFWLLLILISAGMVRLYNPSFPHLSSEEARIANRGYTLATLGKDELGRSFPILFNSLTDYQLPMESYLAAIGELIFGKSEFGARIPFILISLLIIIIIYKISKIFSSKQEMHLFSAFIASFTPALIFFAKIPNEIILLAFSFIILFYILVQDKINLFSLTLTTVFTLSTSKLAWWIIIPFTCLTLRFFQIRLQKKVLAIISFLTIAFVIVFFQVPQSNRSILENDFSILQDPGIRVTLDRLRGQGLEAGWPNFLERILFNKLQIIIAGFINWLSLVNPSILFGQFDETGKFGFIGMGAFPKFAIFPFLAGLVLIIKNRASKLAALILLYLLLTFPLALTSQRHQESVVITLPFLVPIAAVGLVSLKRFLKYTILVLVILEVLINIFYAAPQIKLTNNSRPVWVNRITTEAYNLSVNNQVAVSDDFTNDITAFLEWYTPLVSLNNHSNIEFPYKFRQTRLANIRIIGSEDTFYFCGLDKPTYVFASKRDLEKIQKWLNIDTPRTVEKIYKDELDKNAVYLLKPTICIH